MLLNVPKIVSTRARFFHAIRRFFDDDGFLEVDTPALSPAVIPESTIELFRTEFRHPFLAPRDLYLLPSPEYWMKRLLAAGSGNIYQMSHAFRNAENLGTIHSTEFTMLEWYAVASDYRDNMDRCEALVESLVALQPRPDVRVPKLRNLIPFRRMSMAELFDETAGIDLAGHMEGDSLREECGRLGIRVSEGDTWGDWFNRIFVDRVEPELVRFGSVLIYDYPARVPTLARAKEGTPWAERWELYMNGIEIANCFSEETHPDAVRSFIESEAANKRSALVPVAADSQFPAIFDSRFPRSSGTALGVDRLIMALTGVENIRGVILFPIHDNLSP